jgi:hypothetical protein
MGCRACRTICNGGLVILPTCALHLQVVDDLLLLSNTGSCRVQAGQRVGQLRLQHSKGAACNAASAVV